MPMQKVVLSSKADEVARNGAHPRIPSLEVLGRPLHFPLTFPRNLVKFASQKQSSFHLSSVSIAAIELKSANSRAPVEATGCGVVLVGVPERTIILRINRHAAVVSPAFEGTELRAAAIEQHERA